jgi:hypothetical protein
MAVGAATAVAVLGLALPAQAYGSDVQSRVLYPGGICAQPKVTGRGVAGITTAYASTWKDGGLCFITKPKLWAQVKTAKDKKTVGDFVNSISTPVISGTGWMDGWHSYGSHQGFTTKVR